MKNVDVEIYVSQLISFFEKNPNDLIVLIGDLLKKEFFDRIKTKCYENVNNGDEISLTQRQIIDIVVDLKKSKITNSESELIDKIFLDTKFGKICKN